MEYNSNEFKEHSSHDIGLLCRWIQTFQAQLPPSFGFKIRCWEGSNSKHFKLSSLLQDTFFPITDISTKHLLWYAVNKQALHTCSRGIPYSEY